MNEIKESNPTDEEIPRISQDVLYRIPRFFYNRIVKIMQYNDGKINPRKLDPNIPIILNTDPKDSINTHIVTIIVYKIIICP